MEAEKDILIELNTILDFIRWGATNFIKNNLFYGHGSDNAFDEATHLVFYALELPWNFPEQYFKAKLTTQEKQTIYNLIIKRITTKKPLAYLVNQSWFCGLQFYVNEDVLIPRSPIGELIKNNFAPWLPNIENIQSILDLCCGSGCLGIAAAYQFNQASVDLIDISSKALDVAETNINMHNLEHRLQTLQSDLFENLSILPVKPKYQLIICNPPYVDAEDMNNLPTEFSFEPQSALASGKDGLDCTRKILASAGDYLDDNGILVLELGNSYVHFQSIYKDIPVEWVNLQQGGHGVFIITAATCKKYRNELIEISQIAIGDLI
jgi:ribosomal protein L3 glutamine methyltransferase